MQPCRPKGSPISLWKSLAVIICAMLVNVFAGATPTPAQDCFRDRAVTPTSELSTASIPAPKGLKPSGTIGTARPTYKWQKVAGATRYQCVLFLPDVRKTILRTTLVASSVCSDNLCSYTPKVNLMDRSYRIKVRAGNGSAWGAYTAWKNFVVSTGENPAAIIIDHTATDLSRIPDQWISAARQLTFHFGHTSHGSQIIAGLGYWNRRDDKYNFKVKGDPPGLPSGTDLLKLYDGNNYNGDDYITPELYWSTPDGLSHTRSVADTGLFDFSMWSWCGQQSDNSLATVQQYVNAMASLQASYPDMRFILMTGHTDPWSTRLQRNNDKVWHEASSKGRVLFDFADMERFDPDGNYYPGADDSCPWCDSWCKSHPEQCVDLPDNDGECAHSHGFMCRQKGAAFWWMMARLAGWDGRSP
jgi:hypothetical protein